MTSFDWLDLSLLKGIDEEFREILRGSIFIDETRCDALCFALRKRVEMITAVFISPARMYLGDDLRFDVEKNVEYSQEQSEGGVL